MQRLKAVDIISCAKIAAAIYGGIGVIAIPLLVIAGLASIAGEKDARILGIAFVAFGIFAPVFYGAMGFLFGALGAWIYNLAASRLGGIKIELTEG
jgi:hypothetical protein